MPPKYAVGEVVILQSVSSPEFNGEYTVIDVLQPDSLYRCRLTGDPCESSSHGLGYRLDGVVPTAVALDGGLIEGVWAESALRKRHQPGMEFGSLIESLTRRTVVEA